MSLANKEWTEKEKENFRRMWQNEWDKVRVFRKLLDEKAKIRPTLGELLEKYDPNV